jgi:hypothetical protein
MDECSAALQFDTQTLSRDLASQISFLEYVNKDNYEDMKKNYSASVTDYFDGSFEEFQKKREKLVSLISRSQVHTLHENYFQHTLSPAGAQAYAECLSLKSQNLISAWVEKFGTDAITVKVKTGVLGAESVTYTVSQADPNEAPVELTAGSSQTLSFWYNPRAGITININAKAKLGGGSQGVSLLIPGVRKLEKRTERRELTTYVEAGAGCQGNSAGCMISQDSAFVADAGWRLLPETIVETRRERVWPLGGSLYLMRLEQEVTRNADGEAIRVDVRPRGQNATDANTQCNWRIYLTCQQEREYIAEVL